MIAKVVVSGYFLDEGIHFSIFCWKGGNSSILDPVD